MGAETRRIALAVTLDLRFSERLRDVRLAREIPLRELAETLEMNTNRLSAMEIGRTRPGTRDRTPPQPVSIGEAVALCKALGVGLGVMLGNDPIDLRTIEPRGDL